MGTGFEGILETLYRTVVEASPAIMFVFQGETNVYANPAAEAVTGFTRAELADLKFWDIIHPDSQDVVRERGAARQRGESVPATYEVKIRTKSGEARWLQFTGRPIEVAGKPAVLGTAFDITDRVRAETLATSKAVFHRLVESARVGVLQTDRQGRILYANRATLQMLGFDSLEALQAQGMQARYRDQGERERLLVGLRHDGVVDHVEIGLLDRRGRPVRVAASVVLEGEILSGVLLDITERERLEQEALRGQKLDSLTLLAGGLAHDFNNFMAAILSNLTLARRAEAQADEYLAEAERAVLRARGLTDQLLTFARGGGEPRLEAVDPRALLEEAVPFALRGSRVSVEWSLDGDLPAVRGDANQLSQVIHNLTLNAAQAMPDGGTLRISARKTGEGVQIAFEDEGPGIPLCDQSRIFDPYFTTKAEGSGLGLASAHSILRDHGGVLQLESELGAGARFRFALPVAGTDLPSKPAVSTPLPQLDRERSILVLDDEPVVLRSTGLLLELLGYHVTSVEDGQSALEAWERAREREQPFDLLLLDLTVPDGMGGVGVLEELRARGADVRAVLMSGYAPEDMHARGGRLGAAGFVRKPFTLEDLAETLERAL